MLLTTNVSNSDICSDEGDKFFRDLFEEKTTKVISVVFATVGIFFLIPLTYGIIWYEHFGSDKKRTLLNKFVSSLCWAFMEWFWIIQIF